MGGTRRSSAISSVTADQTRRNSAISTVTSVPTLDPTEVKSTSARFAREFGAPVGSETWGVGSEICGGGSPLECTAPHPGPGVFKHA